MKIFNKLILKKVFQFGILNNKYIEIFLKSRKIKKNIPMESSQTDDFQEPFSPDFEVDLSKGTKEKKKKIMANNNNFKLNKKLSQGIKVLCFNEQKKFEELCDANVHKNFFVIHFGNGILKKYFIFYIFSKETERILIL